MAASRRVWRSIRGPTINAADATAVALAAWRAEFPHPTGSSCRAPDGYVGPDIRGPELQIYVPALTGISADENGALVWHVSISTPHGLDQRWYFVDAHDGALLHTSTDIRSNYRDFIDCTDPYNIDVCYRSVYLPEYPGYRFGRIEEDVTPCGVNPIYGGTDTDNLYDLVPQVDSYLLTKFQRNGANGHGGLGTGLPNEAPLTSTWATVYLNGYRTWNDFCPNAWFNKYEVEFCAGTVVPDFVMHEHGHAIPFWSHLDGSGSPIGMVYYRYSGALDESQSDLLGEFFELFRSGSTDWIVGDAVPTFPEKRNLADPASVFNPFINSYHPDRFNSPNMYCGEADFGGVHHNSTIPSKGIYLVTVGGTFNGCAIRPLGVEKAEQILYRAVTQYYSTSADFHEAYADLTQAARDLYSPADVWEVTKALRAVEMDQPGYCAGGGWTPHCYAPGDLNCDGQVDFSDINPFVLALADPAGYAQQYPDCNIGTGDCNGDGEVNFSDINPFVALLSGSQ